MERSVGSSSVLRRAWSRPQRGGGARSKERLDKWLEEDELRHSTGSPPFYTRALVTRRAGRGGYSTVPHGHAFTRVESNEMTSGALGCAVRGRVRICGTINHDSNVVVDSKSKSPSS